MKTIASLSAAPIALLWSKPQPLMLVTLGLTDLGFNGEAGESEVIEFAADLHGMKALCADLTKMTSILEARSKELGYPTEVTQEAADEEMASEEQIEAAVKAGLSVTDFMRGKKDN